MSVILGYFGATALRYVVIALVTSALSFGGIAWLRYSARAPYQAQVVELKDVIKKRDAAANADRQLAEAEAKRAEELKDEIAKLGAGASCRLSPDELKRLQRLSGANK
jgi:uncharacterized membrane protein YtjA (UPF0391 family)